MDGSAVLTTEMSRTTRIWAARATASSAQDFAGDGWFAGGVVRSGSGWAVWDIGTPRVVMGRSGGLLIDGWSASAPAAVPVRTAATTSVMARTDSVAGPWSSSRPAWVECTVRWTRLVESAASWSWAAAQPAPSRDSEAVSTASGRPPSVVSAWAWAKTSGTTDSSSRTFRAARAVEVSAWTWAAAGPGRWGAGASREPGRGGPGWAAARGRAASRRTGRGRRGSW